MSVVPESDEVIKTVVWSLRRQHAKAFRDGAKPKHYQRYRQLMAEVTGNPVRAFQVARYLADATVAPVRSRVDLSDPEVGFQFQGRRPDDCEIAAAIFLNQVLRHRYADALTTFGQVVATSDSHDSEVQQFLALLLTVERAGIS